MEAIRVSFNPRFDDIAAMRQLAATIPGPWRARRWVPWMTMTICFACLVIALWMSRNEEPNGTRLLLTWEGLKQVLVAATIPCFYLLFRKRGERRQRREFEASQAMDECVVTLSETHYCAETHGARRERRWETFDYYLEGKTLFLLFMNDLEMEILPKRAMTDVQVMQARGLFQLKVGRSKRFPVTVPQVHAG